MRDPAETRIFHPAGTYDPLPGALDEGAPLPAPNTTYIVTGLQAFTEYEFQVICENDLGKAASVWTRGTTAEAGSSQCGTSR